MRRLGGRQQRLLGPSLPPNETNGPLRVLRLEPDLESPNIIWGYRDNFVDSAYGATISGDGTCQSLISDIELSSNIRLRWNISVAFGICHFMS